MIKTTSFSPRPRSLSAASSPVMVRQKAIRAAKSRSSSEQPTLEGLFERPQTPPEISAAQARELIQQKAPRSKTKAAPEPKPVQAAPVESVEDKPLRATKAAKPVAPAKQHSLPAAPIQTAGETAPTPPPAKKVRMKRALVPVNLAEQYGQSLSKRAEGSVEAPVVEVETPKKRLNRAQRQARRELMNPDDDLRARLQRAQSAMPSVKVEKRPRGWRFDCGRCGQTSFFQTSGALCGCGALAIKE